MGSPGAASQERLTRPRLGTVLERLALSSRALGIATLCRPSSKKAEEGATTRGGASGRLSGIEDVIPASRATLRGRVLARR